MANWSRPRPSSCCCSHMITRYIPFTLLAMQTNGHKITATSMCYCLVPSNSNRLLQNPPKSPPSKVANILVCALGCLQSPSTCTVTSASSYLDIFCCSFCGWRSPAAAWKDCGVTFLLSWEKWELVYVWDNDLSISVLGYCIPVWMVLVSVQVRRSVTSLLWIYPYTNIVFFK